MVTKGRMHQLIEDKVRAALPLERFDIFNESQNHRRPPGAESHFKLVIVSTAFEGLSLVARHRKVNEVLAAELKHGVHALSLHTYTPEEAVKESGVPESPLCTHKKPNPRTE